MANPGRPQYQEIVESTWGQAVADTVVRRYATAAERDTDLVAFTPADLFGQLVVVSNPNGKAFLQIHNGTGWVSVLDVPADGAVRELSGTFIGPVLQWGVVNIVYPAALGAGRNCVHVQLDYAEGYYPGAQNGDFASVTNNNPNGFQVGIKTNANAQLAQGTAVCFHWRACVPTAPVPGARPGPAGDDELAESKGGDDA